MRKLFLLSLVASLFVFANSSFAYGPHDPNCVECHSIHMAKGDKLPAVNLSQDKYKTGETVKGTDAFCLGCHNKNVGILPVDLHKTHPVGITPKKAKVPASNLAADGMFGCMSCHDPHPSNPNYKYLVVDTNGGKNMGKFCSYCHPAQASSESAQVPTPAPKPAVQNSSKKK